MKSRGSFRNITLTVSADIRKIYTDEDGNFVCNDFVLGKIRWASLIQLLNPRSVPSK